jgi:hypothetical protein
LILFRLLHCIRHARGISLGGNHDGMNFLFFGCRISPAS